MTSKQIKKLVEKAQAGDNAAMELLYTQFYNQIYFYVYSRVGNLHITQDIVADVFLVMVEGIKKFKGQSSFKNYMFGVTKNKLRDYIRNKYKTTDYISQSYFEEDSFNNIAAEEKDYTHRNKMRNVLKEIYDMMRPKYAKVLDLRFNQMNSVEEAAEALNISPNNLKVIQHRAIKQAGSIWNKLHETNDFNINS